MRVTCKTYVLCCLFIRQKSSGAEGERLKEATNINKSLSTLGFVIPIWIFCQTYKWVCFFKSKLVFQNVGL